MVSDPDPKLLIIIKSVSPNLTHTIIKCIVEVDDAFNLLLDVLSLFIVTMAT